MSGVQSRVICGWSFECKLPWSWLIGHLANIGDILNNLHFNSTKYLNPNTARFETSGDLKGTEDRNDDLCR